MITFWAAFTSGILSGIAIGMIAGAVITLGLLWVTNAAIERWGGPTNAA